mmetsp:Transcript_18890/g.49565  ORF Transcript_18890/g.49565 Transcript_18890/m.49565 type:complete len:283 (+) Transcript_18890:1289-2137(+)
MRAIVNQPNLVLRDSSKVLSTSIVANATDTNITPTTVTMCPTNLIGHPIEKSILGVRPQHVSSPMALRPNLLRNRFPIANTKMPNIAKIEPPLSTAANLRSCNTRRSCSNFLTCAATMFSPSLFPLRIVIASVCTWRNEATSGLSSPIFREIVRSENPSDRCDNGIDRELTSRPGDPPLNSASDPTVNEDDRCFLRRFEASVPVFEMIASIRLRALLIIPLCVPSEPVEETRVRTSPPAETESSRTSPPESLPDVPFIGLLFRCAGPAIAVSFLSMVSMSSW